MKLKLRNVSKKDILTIVLGVVIIALVIWLAMVNNRITQVSNELRSSNEIISKLNERVKKYTYNPQSLNECLNNAAHEYTNYISTHGTPVPNEKGVGYSMDPDQWAYADSSLKKKQSECNMMFSNH